MSSSFAIGLPVVASISLLACASNSPTAPSDPVPEVFALPADAPRDAAVPAATQRITISKIEMRNGGALVSGNTIPADLHPAFSAWVFCPRGLEGVFDTEFNSSGVSGVPVQPGYNHIDLHSSLFVIRPGSYSYTLTLWKRFIPVARRTIDLIVE